MTKRYTASDFANAQFAKHEDGRTARRIEAERGTVFAWSMEHEDGEEDYCADEHLVAHGWVPVPTKPTITENQFLPIASRLFKRWPDLGVFMSNLQHELSRLGIEVIPDPKPTNAEKLELIWADWDPTREGVWEFFDRRGVKAPGGDDE